VITKLDVISWVQNNRFTDFSVIYQFKFNNESLNASISNIERAISDNILMLQHEGNYFKMAKRMFALARIQNKRRIIEGLSPMFNGDLGRMYHVYGDIGTLESLFEMKEDVPYSALKLEIDQFKGRLSNVGVYGFLKNEEKILKDIEKAESKASMEKALGELKAKLYEIMSRNAKAYLLRHGLMRLSSLKTRRDNKKALSTTLKKSKFIKYY
jgi:hypothetical protein